MGSGIDIGHNINCTIISRPFGRFTLNAAKGLLLSTPSLTADC